MDTIQMSHSVDAEFIRQVEQESGQNVSLCYQCGNCTAGCPYTEFYDIPVSQIMRGLQAGQRDKLMSCRSIWLCATCESCTTRCPNNIDVARIMDILRHMARKAGKTPEKEVKTFCDAFLDSVRHHGRVFEMGLMTKYMTRTGRFLTDMDLSVKVLPKRKLAMTPHNIVGKKSIAKIFERYNREGGE
ncbi:succinate dehydrogenase/fumarate reductase iron-sulfur subunit [Pseudodesulfovibrio hydrargyri]|uniref:Succinate dehydrogenase/fumarate reductase iron-sulfur subunit n=1 Tax=Pseudodesulfovibrio hydrargyri TaxID=2125990 RepID=A0A1J5N6T7_9BACT|nr:4Fe-4S dicluster domain-containing protein [Pseudodesulfovibrio hydrargyri]OIQ50512.1 succinate dehydrogenase/fumarate reductase iron-sulfur subunit [Pseudodesulfovibrio hydrargyri]